MRVGNLHWTTAALYGKGLLSFLNAAFNTTFAFQAFSSNDEFTKLHLTAPKKVMENKLYYLSSTSTGELLASFPLIDKLAATVPSVNLERKLQLEL